jgi:hypothetical protein
MKAYAGARANADACPIGPQDRPHLLMQAVRKRQVKPAPGLLLQYSIPILSTTGRGGAFTPTLTTF